MAVVRAGRFARLGSSASVAPRPDDAEIVGCAGRLPGVVTFDGSGWGLVTPGTHRVDAPIAAARVRPAGAAVGTLGGGTPRQPTGTDVAPVGNALPARVAGVEAVPSGWHATLRAADGGMLKVNAKWGRKRAPIPGADVVAIAAPEEMRLAGPDPLTAAAAFTP